MPSLTIVFVETGGAKAILLYAGREATEEFGLVHDDSIWKKWGPKLSIGTVSA